MKFYLIEISNLKDGTEPKAVWAKDNYDTAQMQYHQTLASAMANQNVVSCLCQIIDGKGKVYMSQFWERGD